MMRLFVDTSENITVGLLDSNYQWMAYEYIESKKSSSDLHFLIYSVLNKCDVEMSSITGLIHCSGPGSYTGMRVSEGLSNIFDINNVKVNSFYHFEIPFLDGVEKGAWISKAFKGEYFLYQWDNEKNSQKLVEEKDLDESLGNLEKYTGHSSVLEYDLIYTKSLIEAKPKLLEKIVEKDSKKDVYYYRSIEDEFKRK